MIDRPNVLLIFTDQQRFDTIHALGNPVIRTPALDRICEEGTAFTSAYSPSPVCVPARCSLHYGQYPMHTGCHENSFPMPLDGRPSLMNVLTDAGYRTHGIGKCHFTPDPWAPRGFQSRETQEEIPPPASDDYTRWLATRGWGRLPEPHGVRGEMYYIPQVSQLPAELHPTQWVGDRADAFIREHAAADGRSPWFLFTSFIHPHPPFAPPAPWHKLYRAPLMPLPRHVHDAQNLHAFINRMQNRYKYRDQGLDLNLLRSIKAHYYAAISFVDYQVGRLLRALEETGRLDDTLILFAADHGELLGDYGCFGKRSMHDACARVPLLARLPGRFAPRARCDQPASLIDVAPTILAAAGLPLDALPIDGVDLRELADGRSGRAAVHAQYGKDRTAIYTTVTERWKYAYSAPDNREFLFDRKNDPLETRNRAALPMLRDELRRLRTETMRTFVEGGENGAVDGDAWRVYPRAELSPDPDAHLLIQDSPGYDVSLPGYTD